MPTLRRFQKSFSVDCSLAGKKDHIINQNPWYTGFCVLRAFVIVSNQALLKGWSLAKIESPCGLASYDIEEVLHRRTQGRFLKLPENNKSLRSDPKTLEVVGTVPKAQRAPLENAFPKEPFGSARDSSKGVPLGEPATPTTPSPKGIESV